MANSYSLDDPYNLNRFVQAQKYDYTQAYTEIKSGLKKTHWMWYIFPQLDGLASSLTSKYYSIKSLAEARSYLEHPILGPRLIECARVVVSIEHRTAADIFGFPDYIKLKSCATLFAHLLPAESIFEQLLEKFYAGERDTKTLKLMRDLSTLNDIAGSI